MTSLELTYEVAKILDEKKGIDIKAIKVQELTSIGDYFIIASGSSVPQVKALAEEVEEKLSRMGLEPKRVEGSQTATWILLAATAFTLATYDATLGAVMQNVEEMGGDIAAEELFDGNSINELRVAVYWVPSLLALLFRRHVNYNSTRMENLFVNLSILCACVLTIGLAEGANLYGRMAGYFEVAIAISLPYIIKKTFTKDSATFVSGVASLLFLGYFCYEFTSSKNFAADYQAISFGGFLLELVGLK